jgi:beta-ribofuranosylaminobenzene 5'-phosphate synthase
MDEGGYRINGGVGFSISHPTLTLEIASASSFRIKDLRKFPLSLVGVQRLSTIIQDIIDSLNFKNSISLEISGDARTHFGFGTGTAIRLASIEALFIVNAQPYTQIDIMQCSRRGKTSGIGINTYFHGGFIFDVGHKDSLCLLPSNQKEDVEGLPLVLRRSEMPPWQIGICIPQNISPKTEKEEQKLFSDTCPISTEDVHKTLYHTTYGLTSAVLENDSATFSEAIKSIQKCAWKSAERALYNETLFEIENFLYENGASAVGLTSLGPTLFFFGNDIEKIKERVDGATFGCEVIISTPMNHGRKIENA